MGVKPGHVDVIEPTSSHIYNISIQTDEECVMIQSQEIRREAVQKVEQVNTQIGGHKT